MVIIQVPLLPAEVFFLLQVSMWDVVGVFEYDCTEKGLDLRFLPSLYILFLCTVCTAG